MTQQPNWTKKTVSKIVGIQFSVLSPDEIRKCSVAEITSRDTYSNNIPVIGGMFDPRLGVLEPGLKCPTDGLDYIKTPGYFGHIELAKPVFYYQYLPTIIKLLKCVCIKCSKLLISKEANKECMDMKPDDRWSYVHQLATKVKRCGDDTQDGCGCLVPKKIKKENLATLYAEWDGDATDEGPSSESGGGGGGGKEKLNMKMTPEVVLKIFKRISDQDVAFMGFSPKFSRPDWFICQVLAIPPPAVRPSIKMDGNQRSEDDISHTIVNIIKANKTLLEKMNEPSVNSAIIDDWQSLLQYFIATQVDNNIPSCAPVAQRSGRPLKSIKERLNGKQGRVRGNLMGKRVDFSARSVITPDPNLSIRELGVPKKIAMNITKPVVVNNRNRDFLQQLVRNGPDIYPGANILEKKTGGDISLRYMDRSTIVLENGDVVHRHMMDGDGILFNRQPTLHRMSMMCHIVRVMQQGDTFRMNIGDTKPYNADFDGDEMNLHMPQDDEAEAELKGLAAVPYQIISPAKNNSIIGIFQDSLLGVYQFTRGGLPGFDARMAMNLLMGYKNVNPALFSDPKKKITNFQILSQILPPLSMKYKTKQFGGSDDYATSNNVLEIKDGEILRGHIDSGVLASSTNGMIQRICNDFGNFASADFIDDLQNIITEYMKTSAYSVGISDLISDKKTTEKIVDSIKTKKLEVKTIIDNIHIGTFENKSGRTNEEEFELQVTNILNKANGEAGDIGLKSLSKTNRFITMVNAGSKGSKVNIAQMICLVGQQTIDGKRVPYGFDSRTLPHYSKYDDSPGARGFVENSFIAGLTPSEVFFHAMGGRVGLIDTAVKSVTWETPIIIVENDVPKYVKIGEWIDEHIGQDLNMTRIQHMEEQNMEYLELTHPVKIVTMDYEGRVSWESITAVTRHDPGEKLFKISTKAGRNVTVTANKSLLIWNAELNQFREEYTEDVKIGDFVPVAKNVCDFQESSQTQKHEFQLDGYFPRSEYIYGSEIHKANILMKEAMKNRKKIPENWWNENNNNNFTLPFVSKARFQRAIIRSKLESISHNGIYTSNGTRQHSIIPETFSLSYDNGVFIGLFIAEGNINNSKIYITNNDETIRAFVKGWFSKYNIAFTETIKKNKIGGTTTTICGSSCILSKLITMMVGHGAKNKHVPNEAYISNIDFVKGILSGYISGDGYISKNSINSSSCSRRLSEDISLLCSRVGVHAKLSVSQLKKNNLGTKNIQPSYRLSIRATNGQQFAEQITLLHPEKNNKMKSIIWTTKLDKVKTINDAILDEIISIEHVDPANHPKMYDLTIPKTLNFGLANGLQVRDTSQTGYIQRRLIKGMEDIKVEYDMTVRNNKNRIVQFSYGEDGIDTVKIEHSNMNFIGMTPDELYAHFYVPVSGDSETTSELKAVFSKAAFSRMKKQQKLCDEKSKKYTEFLMKIREDIVVKVFKNKNTTDAYLPLSFSHVVANVAGMQKINKNSEVDVTPLETFIILEETYARFEHLEYAPPTELFKVMYYYSLTPRDLLMVKRFNRKALVALSEMMVLMYKRAIVAPGEMVGMIAAQSIGEPTTQLTLNTFHLSGDASKSQVTRGLPRIEELLSLSENTKNPSTTIYLKPSEESNKDAAADMIPFIELTRLEDIVKSVEICFDPSDSPNETKITADRLILAQYAEFQRMLKEVGGEDETECERERSKWILRMEMDRESMYEKRVTMDDVHFAIKAVYSKNDRSEVSCIYSDYNSDNLVFRIRLDFQKKEKDPKTLDQTDKIYQLKTFQDALMKNIILRGIKGIKTVLARKVVDLVAKENNTYRKKETWVLDAVGSNFMEILSLQNIDARRTISNDIQEINRVLGIEAARQALFNELYEAFDTTYINHHHISLLCDRMTCKSEMVSIFRHGINNDDIGPIAKASFEETPEMFLKAARHAELDEMRGVSANVMCGQEGYFGTSAFKVMLDIGQIMKMGEVATADKTVEEEKDALLQGFMDKIAAEDPLNPCSKNKLTIQSTLDKVQGSNLGSVDEDYDMGF
jgi:DNA-directed RNA polymerase beta' subunit/intein/homing endonuclease